MLAITGVAALGGCTSHRDSGHSPQVTAKSDAIRERTLAAEADLIARYDAALALPAITANPALVTQLQGIRAEHAAHAAAVREGYTGATHSPSPTPATSTSSAPPAPTDAKTAVTSLVKAEQDAANALTTDVLAADGPTAQLLASIAASESGHAALLLGGSQ